MLDFNTNTNVTQVYRFSDLTSFEIGFMRLVRLVLRACRILVRARVRLRAADLPMSNCTPHWRGSDTTRPLLGPAPQRQAILSRPERDLRQTF